MRRYLGNVNGSESLVYVLLILAIAMIISILISVKTTKLKTDKKKYFIYIVIQSICFLIFGSVLYNLKDTSIMQRFVSFQIYFGFAGVIHLYLFHAYFDKFDSKKIHTQIFLAFSTALYLSVFLLIIASYFNEIGRAHV